MIVNVTTKHNYKSFELVKFYLKENDFIIHVEGETKESMYETEFLNMKGEILLNTELTIDSFNTASRKNGNQSKKEED